MGQRLFQGKCVQRKTGGVEIMVGFMIAVSVMMSIMSLPHIITMIRTKSSRDQSLIGLLGVALGICCWIWYGFIVGDFVVVYCNLLMLFSYLVYIGTAVYYRIEKRYKANLNNTTNANSITNLVPPIE